jgi:hypothetical protein
VVVGSGRLEPGREAIDRDVARTQLVGEDGCDGFGAGNVDDRAAVTELARRLLTDHGGGAHRGVHDDVDTSERGSGLGEQTLDVELVGYVGADGERRAVRGEDLLDRGFGFALVAQVNHDDGVAASRERARDRAAGAARAAGDDRHWVGSRHAATLASIAGGRASVFPGTPSLVV